MTSTARAAALAERLGTPIDHLFGPVIFRAAELARLKGCNEHTVTDAVKRGELDGTKTDRDVLIPAAAGIPWQPRPQGGQPRLEPIKCAYRFCGVRFTPRDATKRFCPGTNHGYLEREACERDRLEAAREGRLETRAAALELNLSERSLVDLAQRHVVDSGRVRVGGGKAVLLFERVTLRRFLRARHQSADPRVRRYRDPAAVMRWALRRGLPLEHAEELARRAGARRRAEARVRVDVSGRPRVDDVRELLRAAAQQAVYRWRRRLDDLSYGQLCWEAAQAVWDDQVARNEYDWLPREWASRRQPGEIDPTFKPNVKARVRDLVGDDLKKLLQTAGSKVT
jgi:hypothetical protein